MRISCAARSPDAHVYPPRPTRRGSLDASFSKDDSRIQTYRFAIPLRPCFDWPSHFRLQYQSQTRRQSLVRRECVCRPLGPCRARPRRMLSRASRYDRYCAAGTATPAFRQLSSERHDCIFRQNPRSIAQRPRNHPTITPAVDRRTQRIAPHAPPPCSKTIPTTTPFPAPRVKTQTPERLRPGVSRNPLSHRNFAAAAQLEGPQRFTSARRLKKRDTEKHYLCHNR